MKKTLLVLFVGLNFAATAQVNTEWLTKYINTQREMWNVPGLAVSLVKDDSLIFTHGSGVLKNGQKENVNANTQFGIASNTKAFTAAAIALLVEEGKLNWDDKVTKHLPWFELYDPYVTSNFTIRDLLTHHSGLATFSGDAVWYASALSRVDIIKRAKYLKPVTGFRQDFGYSNIMYLAAGEVITNVSGMNYDDFISEKFFKPLGMNTTNSSIKNNPAKNVAMPHAQVNDKNITIPFVDWDNIAAAGAINSNVVDLAQWMRMWLNKGKYKGKEILKSESVNEVWNVVTPYPANIGASGPRGNIQMSGYGCGWEIMIYRGVRVVHHAGGLDGMVSHTVLLPEKNMGFVILCNAGVGLPGVMVYDIVDNLLGLEHKDYASQIYKRAKEYYKKEAFADAKLDKEVDHNKKSAFSLTDIEGTYAGNVYGSVTITINKKAEILMTFEHTPSFKTTLTHWEGNNFVFKFSEYPSLPRGWVTFYPTEDGKKVYEMKIDLPNPDFDFLEFDLIKK